MNFFHTFARYKLWANEVFYSAVATLSPGVITANQPIIFGSIIGTLHHVYAMDLVWKAHLEGKEHGMTTRIPRQHPPFAKLRSAQASIDDWYVRYSTGLTEAAATETVHFQFIGGGAGKMTRGDILLHVINHNTYHRGHVAGMLYPLSIMPPATDFPVFLREDA